MKNIIFFILISLFFVSQVSAQEKTTDTQSLFNKALSFHYANKDSAYFYYEKTIAKANKENNITTLLNSYYYLTNVNGNYYDLKNYHKNIKRQEKLLFTDKRLDTFSFLNDYKKLLLFDKGNYNYKIKQYESSKTHFKNLLEKLNKEKFNKTNIETLQSVYSFLGAIYKNTGKFEVANSYYEKSIHLTEANKDSLTNWESKIHSFKKLQAKNFIAKKEFKKANKLLSEAFVFYSKNTKIPQFKNNFISTYVALAKNNIKQKHYHKAIQILNENTRFLKTDNPFDREIEILYGDAYLGLNFHTKADFYYKRSLEKTKQYRNNNKHQDVALIYAKLGELSFKQQEYEEALQNYQKALMQLENSFVNENFADNPNPEKVVSKTTLIAVLKEKLTTLFTSYKSTNQTTYLKNAYQAAKTIVKTLDALRPEFESKIDKQFLINETYPSLQKSVAIAYELYKKTGDDNFIDEAFYFTEKSKSILLLEAQRNSEATKYGEVPENMLTKERQFRADISHLEQTLFKDKTDNQSLKDSLFSVKNKYQNYLTTIEKSHPKYYALKYKSDVVSLKKMQAEMQDNQLFLSYLVADEVLFLTTIENNKKAFYKLPFSQKTKNLITKLYKKSAKIDINDPSIYKDSYAVYKSILAPILSKTKATDLTICADDILNYLPFDALMTSDENQDYLLKSHAISYTSSATLFVEQSKKRNTKKSKLLVFAPKFTETTTVSHDRNNFSPLIYNEQEAKNISQYFSGTVYNGNNASIVNFKKELATHNLLHFATHASANDAFPDYSYLAFSDDKKKSNLLYVKDIYNYQINADLVTLSACETGVGKLQKGEGMMSLARAFNYAGVPSIVTTLWKINDQSTSEIMEYFYKNLYNGLSKKEALRQAKLSYLELCDDPILKHPYYWSGIVLTGNTDPVASKSMLIWLLLGTFVLILIRAVVRKRKAK